MSNSGPSVVNAFRTFHLDVDLVGAGSGGGGTPPERILLLRFVYSSDPKTNYAG